MQTVLVVDDEVHFLDILQVILQRAGFKTLVTTNGREGLELVYQNRPDLVVLDDMLPGISGGEICMKLKHDPDVSHIPVILYSAGPRVRDREFLHQIQADAVLNKPFKPGDVVKIVMQCLAAPV